VIDSNNLHVKYISRNYITLFASVTLSPKKQHFLCGNILIVLSLCNIKHYMIQYMILSLGFLPPWFIAPLQNGTDARPECFWKVFCINFPIVVRWAAMISDGNCIEVMKDRKWARYKVQGKNSCNSWVLLKPSPGISLNTFSNCICVCRNTIFNFTCVNRPILEWGT
jgi:hypothetical protein